MLTDKERAHLTSTARLAVEVYTYIVTSGEDDAETRLATMKALLVFSRLMKLLHPDFPESMPPAELMNAITMDSDNEHNRIVAAHAARFGTAPNTTHMPGMPMRCDCHGLTLLELEAH